MKQGPDAAVLLFIQAIAASLHDLKQNPQPEDSLYAYAVARLRGHIGQAPEADPEVRRLAGRMVDVTQEVLAVFDDLDAGA